MSHLARRLWRALRSNQAETRPDAEDSRLCGRTYAIPFEQVWQAALALAGGGLSQWRIVHADDQEGVLRAEASAPVLRSVSRVTIHIGLDDDAQTRVDALSASLSGRTDLGANARKIDRFFTGLDRQLSQDGRPAAVIASRVPH